MVTKKSIYFKVKNSCGTRVLLRVDVHDNFYYIDVDPMIVFFAWVTSITLQYQYTRYIS